MPLTHCADPAPAQWITASPLPWAQLVSFGPAGFAAYARLRFLPDPAYPGQDENDAEPHGGRDEQDTLRVLFDVLAAHTTTPGDCFFALWEGWGDIHGSPAMAVFVAGNPTAPPDPRPQIPPAFGPDVLDGPKLTVPNRSYFLFRGPIGQAGDWGAAEMWPGQPRFGMPGPSLAWPADHAWCVAHDVDPHWAGIGASAAAIQQLLDDPRLDVVAADPGEPQPAYR